MVTAITPCERPFYPKVAQIRNIFNACGGSEAADIVLPLTINGRLGGGLLGSIDHDWLYVDVLAVREELRGAGYGSRLLREAEDIAARQGLRGVWLYSHSFQAPGFYDRCGYRRVGALPHYPGPAERVFFCKETLPAPSTPPLTMARVEQCSRTLTDSRSRIAKILLETQAARGFPWKPHQAVFTLREEGNLVGGLTGHRAWDWFQIDCIGMAPRHSARRDSLEVLLNAATAAVQTDGIRGAWLHTADADVAEAATRQGFSKLAALETCEAAAPLSVHYKLNL